MSGLRSFRPQSPPILQTSFHSAAVTGCTDSRDIFDQRHVLELRLCLDRFERHRRLGSGSRAAKSTTTQGSPGLGGRIGIVLAHHLDDADDLLADIGMIEEGEVALLHLHQVQLGGVIADAGPGLALLAGLATCWSQDQTSGSLLTSQ